jgi:RNA polymerase sigma-70 factor (ECF subfamily)
MESATEATSASAPSSKASGETIESESGDQEMQMIARARAGQAPAWTFLYQKHQPRLLRHLTYMVGEVELARELAQETFAQALLALPRFAQDSSFSTWLCAIGNNLAKKHWRSQSRRENAYENFANAPKPATAGDPEAQHLGRRRADALKAGLETLPDNLREAFILIDLQELPVAQAAAQLGITPESLAMRCSRARAKIRDFLRANGWLAKSEASS